MCSLNPPTRGEEPLPLCATPTPDPSPQGGGESVRAEHDSIFCDKEC